MNRSMLEEVRRPLLDEARRSPALLSDLAGLEQYVAETYDARSFVELLQNADDAGASKFVVQRVGDFLLVANDGRPFTSVDFKSLCRSAASQKHRGATIGYRGIGFKSVVGFAETVYVFSGELEAVFSRERTAREVPGASRVPLVRIPHPVEAGERSHMTGALDRMAREGFHTTFVFKDLVASGIEAEFAAFDSTSMLFLRHVRQVELRATVEEVISARRENLDARTRSIRLVDSSGPTLWRVVERGGIALAFSEGEEGIERLEEREAVVHAFLRTHELTGLAAKINGDISTDPSRTRVILDERTAMGIANAASLVIDLVAEGLQGGPTPMGSGLMAPLVPFQDPRLARLQRRSFKTELLEAIRRAAEGRFEDLRYRPSWLNAADFERLAATSRLRAVPRDMESVEGLSTFLRFVGAREATLEDLRTGLGTATPSPLGAAEIVSQITKLHATKQLGVDKIDPGWRLWPVDGDPVALGEAQHANKPLDRSFTDMVSERIGVGSELRRLVSSLLDPDTASRMMPDQEETEPRQPGDSTNEPRSPASPTGDQPRRLSLKKWRSAEQQVLSLLELQGWDVKDVSHQNLGYDIEGITPEGEEIFMEVKAIDHPGQSFTLTSNEEATARQEGTAYRLAVVRQAGADLEVAFIPDPANRLELTRKCRQWVWECLSYEYEPDRFLLE
jgi:hypothetical protein